MTNMTCWSDAAAFDQTWGERARFAARFIRPGLDILDLGCGAMDLERVAAPRSYMPLDVAARDARTEVVDLNEEPIPAHLLHRADLVTLLGVIEYLDDVPGLFGQLVAGGKPVLFTYCVVERNPGVDRRSNDWVNDFSTADLRTMLATAGLEVTRLFVFDRNQVLITAEPAGRPSPGVATAAAALARPRSAGSRRSIVVAGHYGRGNCGDEALLQCAVEALRDSFDIIVSVDEHGAYDGFWNWYPYQSCRIIHRTNDAEFYRDPTVAGVLVGGGGLPLGYAANHVVEARLAGKTAVLAGVDSWPAKDVRWIEPYTRFFDHVAFRSAQAVADAGRFVGVPHSHGGDWALMLPTDDAAAIGVDRSRALVTVREFDLAVVPHAFTLAIEAMLARIRARGYAPVFLPFGPEDERFLADLGLDRGAPVERCWWNPRRTKQVIASSGMMLSVGRLHPLIFAAAAGVPVASIAPPLQLAGIEGIQPKLGALAAELGIDAVTLPEGLDRILDAPRPADAAKVAAATERARAMAAHVRSLFAAASG